MSMLIHLKSKSFTILLTKKFQFNLNRFYSLLNVKNINHTAVYLWNNNSNLKMYLLNLGRDNKEMDNRNNLKRIFQNICFFLLAETLKLYQLSVVKIFISIFYQFNTTQSMFQCILCQSYFVPVIRQRFPSADTKKNQTSSKMVNVCRP